MQDWERLVPAIMIGVGAAFVLVGLVARRRHWRAEEASDEGHQVVAQPRPQMAPLPRLLSTARADDERR